MASKFVKIDNTQAGESPSIQIGTSGGGVTKIVAIGGGSHEIALPGKSGTLATLSDVGGSGGGIPEAPQDGKNYGRKDAAWSEIVIDSSGKEPAIAAGTTAQYWRGDKSWQTLNTTAVAEGTNLYFTNARAIGSALTGFATGANSAITSSDTVLGAFQKAQGQIEAKANTASPTFTGTATFSVINATSTITGNTVAVNAGGSGSTTITRASSSTNYTATLPAKDGTIAMLSDISGGGSVQMQSVTVTANGNVTAPVWAKWAFVVARGGGGGGSSKNADSTTGYNFGKAGCVTSGWVAVTGGASYSVTVGTGGTGSTTGPASNGGSSSALGIVAAGGKGGGIRIAGLTNGSTNVFGFQPHSADGLTAASTADAGAPNSGTGGGHMGGQNGGSGVVEIMWVG